MSGPFQSFTSWRRRFAPPHPLSSPSEDPNNSSSSSKRYLLRTVLGGVVLLLLLRTMVFQVYGITTPSMEATLRSGDYVIAHNTIFGAAVPATTWRLPEIRRPRFGDVVVYEDPQSLPTTKIIKRVVGEPGDTLEMLKGILKRNGHLVDEPNAIRQDVPDEPIPASGPYSFGWQLDLRPANQRLSPYAPSRDTWGPLIIPPETYFVMGDNRNRSRDSRYLGVVQRKDIKARVVAIYYSIGRQPAPDGAGGTRSHIRWERIGRIVR
jgi:signal peptidase I